MLDKFVWKKFSEVNLGDSFFDSLKSDYAEFSDWFNGKSKNGEEALIYHDEFGISSFIYLKNENEEIKLVDKILPKKNRIKIGTFRLAERVRGKRLGEGALGVSLWRWQESKFDEIYVTVFDKHEVLIDLFEKFGFKHIGNNERGERVYIKSRINVDYSTPYTSFPFIDFNVKKTGMIPINDEYHDKLFPYSTLQGVKFKERTEEDVAGNGISKVFIGFRGDLTYSQNEPVLVYRIFKGQGQATYKSVITSYCTLIKQTTVKVWGKCKLTKKDYLDLVRNRAVFDDKELARFYDTKQNLTVLELVYNGYFGAGNNINHATLKNNGLFEAHPYNIRYSLDEFEKILEMGETNVQNVIINKP